MSEGGELVHFHEWRAARDRKAATRRLWRSRCSGLVTVPLSIGRATLVLAAGMSRCIGRQMAYRSAYILRGATVRRRPCWRLPPSWRRRNRGSIACRRYKSGQEGG